MEVDHDNLLTGQVIGAAIEVHRVLGPGLEEPAYEEALEYKLRSIGLSVVRQRGLPLQYKGVVLDAGFRIDLLVQGRLPLELKSVETLHPIHDAQLLTYLRLGAFSLGLLMNFNVNILKDGIRRKVQSLHWIPENRARVDRQNRDDPLTQEIIASAIEVHRHFGPGLLPSAYEIALCHELKMHSLPFQRHVPIEIIVDGKTLNHPAEVPLLVSSQVPVFCFAHTEISMVHRKAALARVRQGGWKRGLLLNFNVKSMCDGIVRINN